LDSGSNQGLTLVSPDVQFQSLFYGSLYSTYKHHQNAYGLL